MGRRVHLFKCKDCSFTDSKEIRGGYKQPPYFFEVMEWMDKEELINHIEEIECPVCEGDNWEITDYSVI